MEPLHSLQQSQAEGQKRREELEERKRKAQESAEYYMEQVANQGGQFDTHNPAYWKAGLDNVDLYRRDMPNVPEVYNADAEQAFVDEYGVPSDEMEFGGGQIEPSSVVAERERSGITPSQSTTPDFISWDDLGARQDRQYRADAQRRNQEQYLQLANNAKSDDDKDFYLKLASSASSPNIADVVEDTIEVMWANAPQVVIGASVTAIGVGTGNPLLISYGGGQVARGITNLSEDIGVISPDTSRNIKKGIGVAEIVGSFGGGAAVGVVKTVGKGALTKEAARQLGKRVAKELYKRGIFEASSIGAEEMLRLGLTLKGEELADWINEKPYERGWVAAGIQFVSNAITTNAENSLAAWTESGIASAFGDKPIYASGLLGRFNETMDMGREAAPISQFGELLRDENGDIVFDENGIPIEIKSYEDISLWNKMGKRTFWQNNVASAGFTAGSVVGAGNTSKRIGGITNELRAIKHGVKAVDILGKPMSKGSKMLFDSINGFAMAMPEASVEAYSAYNDYIRNNKVKIEEDYVSGKINAEEYQHAMSVLSEGARVFGNQVLFENTAILTIENALMWTSFFSRGYSSSVRNGSGLASSLRNEWAMTAVSEVETAAKRFGIDVVRDESGKIITGATIKSAGKMLGKSTGKMILNGLSEGAEEGAQGVAQSKVQFMPELTSFYYNSERPDGWRMAREYFGGTVKSLVYNAKGGDQSYEQIMSGIITGVLGMPSVGRNSRGQVRPTWNGGVGGVVRDIVDYRTARSYTERINAQLQDENSDISIVMRTLAGHAADSMDARLALLTNDNFGFENARENSLVRTLLMCEQLGLSEELYGPAVESAIHMTADDVNNLRQAGVLQNVSISSDEYAKKVNEYGTKLREKIDKFKKELGTASMLGLSRRDAEIFVHARMMQENLSERSKRITEEVEKALGMKIEDFYEKDANGEFVLDDKGKRKYDEALFKQKLNDAFMIDPLLRTKWEDKQRIDAAERFYAKTTLSWQMDPAGMSRAVDQELGARRTIHDGIQAGELATQLANAKTVEDALQIIQKSGVSDVVASDALTIAAQEGSAIANDVRRRRGMRSRLVSAYDEVTFDTVDGKVVSGSEIIDAIIGEAEKTGKKYSEMRYEDIANIALGRFGVMMDVGTIRELIKNIETVDVDNALTISILDAAYDSERARGEQGFMSFPRPIREQRREKIRREMSRSAAEFDSLQDSGGTETSEASILQRGRTIRKRISSPYYDTQWGNLSETDRLVVAQSICDDMASRLNSDVILVSSTSQLDDVPQEVAESLRNGSKGVFQDGKIYINAKTIEGMKSLIGTITHEVVAHHGMRSLYASRSGRTDRFNSLCASLFAYAAKNKGALNKELRDIAELYLNATQDEVENLSESFSEEDRAMLGDELLARLSESMVNTESGELERSGFLSIIRSSIRSLFRDRLGFDIGFSEKDIMGLLSQSIKHLERGKVREYSEAGTTRNQIVSSEDERNNVRSLVNERITRLIAENEQFDRRESYETATELVDLLVEQFGVPALVVRNNEDKKEISGHIRRIVKKYFSSPIFSGLYSYEDNNIYINLKEATNLSEIVDTYIHELAHREIKDYIGEEDYERAMISLYESEEKADSELFRNLKAVNQYAQLSRILFGDEIFARVMGMQARSDGSIRENNTQLGSIGKERIAQINKKISDGTFDISDASDLAACLLRRSIYRSIGNKTSNKVFPYVRRRVNGKPIESGVITYGAGGRLRNAAARIAYDTDGKKCAAVYYSEDGKVSSLELFDESGRVISSYEITAKRIVQKDAEGNIISSERNSIEKSISGIERFGHKASYGHEAKIEAFEKRVDAFAEREKMSDEELLEEEIRRHLTKGVDLISREGRRVRSRRFREQRARRRSTQGQAKFTKILDDKAASLKRSNPEMFTECKEMLYDLVLVELSESGGKRLRPSDLKMIRMRLEGDMTQEQFDNSPEYAALVGGWSKWGDRVNDARAYVRENFDALLFEVTKELAHDHGIMISTHLLSESQYRKMLQNEGYDEEEIASELERYKSAVSKLDGSVASDEIDLGLKEEYFDYSVRYTDETLTMSSRMRVALASLVSYDADGNPKINEHTGLPSRQNSKYVYYVLVEALSDCKNKRDFAQKLKSMEGRFGWVRDLLMKMESDPEFKAGVFSTFYKSTVIPRVLNTRTGKVSEHFETTQMRFRARLLYENLGRNVTPNAVFGNDGLAKDKDSVNTLLRRIATFEIRVKNGISEEDFKEQMCELFSACGLVLTPEDIRGDLRGSRFNLNAMRDFLEALRDGKLDNVKRLDAARRMRSMLEVTERTAHIGMLRINGVSYAAHVPMSYLEHRLINLTRGDSRSIAEYVRSAFGQYENFASTVDGRAYYFFDWMEGLANESEGLEYAEVMSIGGRAPEKQIRSVSDYITMAFQVYRSDKAGERFVLPCLGHSGRIMYIGHEGRMSNDEIRGGLKKVVMREVKLARMRAGGKETGSKDFAMLPELLSMLEKGEIVTVVDGKRVALTFDDLIGDSFTEEMAAVCADALVGYVRGVPISEELYKRWVHDEEAGGKYTDAFASREEFEEAYRDFAVRNYFAQTQIAALIGADPSFFDSQANYSKRLQGLQSCNTRPADESFDGEDERIGIVVLKDEEVDCISEHEETASLIDDMVKDGRMTQEQADIVRKRLSRVTSTDGQSYMTLDTYREYMIKVNQWNDKLERMYEAVKSGNYAGVDDYSAGFTPLKLAGYGEYVQILPDGSKIRRPYMIKTSFMPIIPMRYASEDMPGAGNKKLMAVAEYMERSGAKIACFESSVKVGGRDAISIEQILAGKDSGVSFEISSWELGMQQVENTESVDVEVSSGRQRTNLALANIRQMSSVLIGGKSYTAEQIEQIYLAALAAKAMKQYEENVAPEYASREKLIGAVQSMSMALGESAGMDGFMEVMEDGLPMHLAPGQNALQGVILSILKNGAIKSRQYGQVNVQCSAFSEDLHLVIKQSADGRRYIAGMECYMPAPSRKIIERYATFEEGIWKIDMERIPSELKKVIGTRIPTAGYGSMKVLYVKGFLNTVHGSQIILPVEAMVFDGSDFDIDKVFDICPHYEEKEDGSLGKVEYEMPSGRVDDHSFDGFSIEQLDNLLMDINEATWASPEGTAQIMQAGGYVGIQNAKKVLEYIEANRRGWLRRDTITSMDELIKKLDSSKLSGRRDARVYNPLSMEASADGYFKGQLSKNIIAVIAATNSFVPAIQRSEVDLGSLTVRLGGHEYKTLAPVKGPFGQYVSSLIGEKIDAAADMKKDDCLYSLCKDPNQAAMSIVLSILGVDPVHEVVFLNQPEVRDLLNEFQGRQMTGYDIMKFFKIQSASPESLFSEERDAVAQPTWDEMLERSMLDGKVKYDKRIIRELLKVFYISQAITDANLFTGRFDKADSGGMAGSTIAEYIDNMMRVRLGSDLSTQRIPALRNLKAQLRQISFDENGYVDISGSQDRRQAALYKIIFEQARMALGREGLYPWISQGCIDAIYNLYREFGHYDYATGTWETSMDKETIQEFIDDYLQALMQNNEDICSYTDDEGGKHTGYEGLIRMISLFPQRIASVKYDRLVSDNAFLRALAVTGSNNMKRYVIPNLDGLNAEQVDAIRDGWEELLNDPGTKSFALDMYRYALLVSPTLKRYAPQGVIRTFYDEVGDEGMEYIISPKFEDDAGAELDSITFSDYLDRWVAKKVIEKGLAAFISQDAASFHIAQANPRYSGIKGRGKYAWECSEIILTEKVSDERNGTALGTANRYINWDGYLFKYVRCNKFGYPIYRRVEGIQIEDGSVKNYADPTRSIRNDLDRLDLLEGIASYNAAEESKPMEIGDIDEFDFGSEQEAKEQFSAEEYLNDKDDAQENDKPNSELRRVFFDVETSDTYDKANVGNLDAMPHVFQIGYVVTDFDGKVLESESIMIKPDGWKISEEASKVTGHTTEEIMKNPDAMSAKDALSILAEVMNRADCIVGHNVIFDNTVVSAEFARYGLANPLTRAGVKIVDTMRTSYPNKMSDGAGGKKFYTNAELYRELGGVEKMKLHDALNDVKVTMYNFKALQDKGYLNNSPLREQRARSRRLSISSRFSKAQEQKESKRSSQESACRGADGKNLC